MQHRQILDAVTIDLMTSRRRMLGQTACAVFGAGLPLAARPDADRYAPYRGQTVVISIPDHPHYAAMQQLLPAFTQMSGIKVEVLKDPILRMKHIQLRELADPQGQLDLVCYVVMWKTEYVSKKLLQPLSPFFADPALADPNYKMHDIVPGYMANLGLVGGPKGYLPGPGAKLYGLPYGAETSVLAYRRDVFAKHNLQPPSTYAELQMLLPILRDKAGIGALATRGETGHQCVHAWLLHLNPLGGRVFDNQWRPTFQSTAGVQALTLLKDIVDTGPAGAASMNQGAMIKSFLQGDAAMYLDSTVVFGPVKGATSKVEGKVSYVLHPKGVRRASQSGGLGLAIPRNARNANAAFLLMQWLTAQAQDKAVSRLGGAPTRLSTLSDVDLVRQFPEYITLKEQLRYADPDWRPIIDPWDDINQGPLGAAIHQGITGGKPAAQALGDIVPRVDSIMRKAGLLAASTAS